MADSVKQLISAQPGQKARLWTALEGTLRKFALQFDHSLPASIISYDRAKNVAQVQPMLQVVFLDGTSTSRHPLANVPVISMGGGGFHISFPFKKGDLGWIFATDRDYTNFMQSLKESAPNTTRAHKFDDSIFIPDVMRQYTIDASDSQSMVIQTIDAKTRISIKPGQITVTGPTSVVVDTPKATFTHDVEIKGNLKVDQAAEVDGTLTNAGIDVTTHGHLENGAGSRTGNMEA